MCINNFLTLTVGIGFLLGLVYSFTSPDAVYGMLGILAASKHVLALQGRVDEDLTTRPGSPTYASLWNMT